MSHYTISYKDSPCPSVDAIDDIKEWLGQERWDKLYPLFAKIETQKAFELYASFVGVQGFPVIAWWELIHGQGSWKTEEENADD